MDVSQPGVCYLPCNYFQNDTDCQMICETKGGTYDTTESMENPYSPYLCDSGISSASCMNDCEASVYLDWYTGKNATFYGSCELYDMCVVDLNKTLCTANSSASGGWVSHDTDGFPKWMSFDWDSMSLAEGSGKTGRCVLAYSNVNSFLQDMGGNQTYVSSKEACVGFRTKLIRGKQVTNVSGIWRPARGYRPGFMDSNATCKDLCQWQLWVSVNPIHHILIRYVSQANSTPLHDAFRVTC